MLISVFWATSWQFFSNFFLDIEKFYQVLSTCQISDQLDHSNRNYKVVAGGGWAESALPGHTNLQEARPVYSLGLKFCFHVLPF